MKFFRTYNRDSLTHNLQILWLYKIISQNYDDFAKKWLVFVLTMMSFILIIYSTFHIQELKIKVNQQVITQNLIKFKT